MKRLALAALFALSAFADNQQAHAVVCATGVYRAGCAGTNGVVVRKDIDTMKGVSMRRLLLVSAAVCLLAAQTANAKGCLEGAAVVVL